MRWGSLLLVCASCGSVTPAPEATPCTATGITTLIPDLASTLLVLDDVHVFWESDVGTPGVTASIWSMPKDGGESTLITTTSGATPLALDATNIYFTQYDGSTLATVAKSGGDVSLLATGTGPTMDTILVDATTVYVSSRSTGLVQSVAKTGAAFTTLALGTSAHAIAVDGENIYWSSADGSFQQPNESIHATPKAGGVTTTLYRASAYFRGTAADANAIYVAGYDPSQGIVSVTRVETRSGVAAVLFSASSSLSGTAGFQITIDTSFVYVSMGEQSTIVKVPLGGGPPESTLAMSAAQSIVLCAVDDRKSYFAPISDAVGMELDAVCK